MFIIFSMFCGLLQGDANAQTVQEFEPTYVQERGGRATLRPDIIPVRMSATSAPTRAHLVGLIEDLVEAHGGADAFAGQRAPLHGSFLPAGGCENLGTLGLTLKEMTAFGGDLDEDRLLCLEVVEGGHDYMVRLAGGSVFLFYGRDGVTTLHEEPTVQVHWLLPPYLVGQAVYALGCSAGGDDLRFGDDECGELHRLLEEARLLLEDETINAD